MDIKRFIAGILGFEALLMLMGVASALWKRDQTGTLKPATEVLFLMGTVLVFCILMVIGFGVYRWFTNKRNRP